MTSSRRRREHQRAECDRLSNGIFYGSSRACRARSASGHRPLDPVPPPNPPNSRALTKPERLRVDSDALGAPLIDVTLAPSSRTSRAARLRLPHLHHNPTRPRRRPWALWPLSRPCRAVASERTVATFNMQRFVDTANDPPPTTRPDDDRLQQRLNKASLAIARDADAGRDRRRRMGNLTTLQAVATRLTTCRRGGAAEPELQAYLEEGNDIGGIDVGSSSSRRASPWLT